MTRWVAALLALGLSACASAPKTLPSAASAAPESGSVVVSALPSGRKKSPYAPAQEDLGKRGDYQAGGLYAPHIADSTPDLIPDVDAIPEPEVTDEPRSLVGNRSSYSVLGRQYRVLDDTDGYVEQGTASYYGNKFHGRRTSNLEVYDMYAFTAAHKTLPLPSFARITNLDNGKSVVVRVNDRGPFHDGRVVDLSYAAAVKLGITQRGTGRVEVRALTAAHPQPLLASVVAPASTLGSAWAPVPAVVRNPPAAPSTLDRLVAAMPIASAAAGELPPGVRIATGRPTSLKPAPQAGRAPGNQPGNAPDNLPRAAAAALVAAPTTTETAARSASPPVQADAGNDYRFDMRQDGRAMTANEFDAWMKARQVRVATGQSLPVVNAVAIGDDSAPRPVAGSAAVAPPSEAPAGPSAAAATSGSATAPALASAGRSRAGDVTLQVASFSARGNADRALAMLHGAGIDGARLNDANANGQKVWRLRVGPLDPGAAPALATRIAGLGFGPPQRVHD